MNVTKDSVTTTEVTLTISMDADDEEPFLNRSYKKVASRVRIPGFQPPIWGLCRGGSQGYGRGWQPFCMTG
ncbi:MAG: hypothetical protein DSY79_07470 [Chloroflexi bacterium]|nr:MAG: hypothetical protein DSY79_07470 [Chloroflexota bacterium]